MIERRGKPGVIVSDNGTELTSNAILLTLVKMEGNGAAAALDGFTRQMKRLPADLTPQPDL